MSQHAKNRLVTLRTSIVLLIISLLISLIIALIHAHSAKALVPELLDPTTSTVDKALTTTPVIKSLQLQKAVPELSSSSDGQRSSRQTPVGQSKTNRAPVTNTATAAPSPQTSNETIPQSAIPLNGKITRDSLLSMLEFITTPTNNDASSPVNPTVSFATERSTSHSPFMFLEPSESGWRLFGVSWYWWVIAAAAATLAARYGYKRYILPLHAAYVLPNL